MKFKGLVAVLVLISFTGCASIVGQSTFPVAIDSNPSGANVTVTDDSGTNIFSGTTPATVPLAAGESYFHAKVYDLTFSRPGYAEQHAQLRADIDGWYFANFLLPGGILGLLVIDPMTGKMWKLPLHKTVNLYDKTALKDKHSVLKIASLDQVPQEMRKDMVSLN